MIKAEHPGESDGDLVRRLQAGDISAFDSLFEKHRKGIFAYIYRLLRDRDLADDIVQDCFVEFVKKIDKIDPAKGVSSWLYRVARNKAVDLIRKRKHEVVPGDDFFEGRDESDSIDPIGDPASRALLKEKKATVLKALDLLPEVEKEILLMRFFGGLTFRDISDIVEKPLGTVLWQVKRSLEKIRNQVEDGN